MGKSKRITAYMLAVVMLIGVFGIGSSRNNYVAYAEDVLASDTDAEVETDSVTVAEDELYDDSCRIYQGANYEVCFRLDNRWDTGYNATVTIKNTGDTPIENWCVSFPLEQKIANIWNASVQEICEDFYIIKNAGWNQDIPVGGNVSFGITSYESFTDYPDYYTMIGNETEVKSGDYTVAYEIVDDWGEGYKAQITITNNKNMAVEDWRLSFSYGDNLITKIWDAQILYEKDGKYIIGCGNYNQNIQSGQSVTFGIMVEPGCSDAEIVNIMLSEYSSQNSGRYLALMGDLDEDANILSLYMAASEKCTEYELYVSEDGINYNLISDITGNENEAEYLYDLPTDFDIISVYAKGYFAGGILESDKVIVEKCNGGYVVTNSDKDSDKLCDCLEYVVGTDINDIDTDGDGLTDYDEIYCFMTNPLMTDTDEDGINDGDEDFDCDGLSCLEELDLGTDPITQDTDGDNLSDGDEINIYGTNPLHTDSDGEGLTDGDEIKLGLNPLKQDTDDDGVLDCDEMLNQKFSYDIENSERAEITGVSVELSCKGNLDNYAYIEDMYNVDMLSTGVVGLVGVPVDVQVDTEFDEAKLTFTYDESALGDTPEENLRVMWYDEANDEYVILDDETVLDVESNTISYVTNHFSTYMVVDRQVWFDACRQDINYRNSGDVVYYDIMFTVDTSGSMSGERMSLAKTALNTFVDSLMEYDLGGIVSFDNWAELVHPLTASKVMLKDSINDLKARGATNASAGLWMSATQLVNSPSSNSKMIILLCDGDMKAMADFVTFANDNNIVVHCINVTNGTSTEMQKLADATGGGYYYAATSADIIDAMNKLQGDTVNEVDTTDSDGDGLYDVYEVNGVRLPNNQIVYTDRDNPDTDGDGISDFDEVGGLPGNKDIKIDGDVYTCVFGSGRSNPVIRDSDHDGIPDNMDDRPFCKDFVVIASLVNDNYVPIIKGSEHFNGGDQDWWAGENYIINRYGCGVIAMCDTEMYLTESKSSYSLDYGDLKLNNLGECSYDSYKDFVNYRFDGVYHIQNNLFAGLGLLPIKMKEGIQKFYKYNMGESPYINWAPTYQKNSIYGYILEMLEYDIPVVASYHVFSDKKEKLLLYYGYDYNIGMLKDLDKYAQSHYFVITGIVKYYTNDKRYETYLQIATYGERRYVSYDKWLSKIGEFTNILYIRAY